jgi:hypothetical protein
MSDTEHHSVVRRTERHTDAEKQAHQAYIEELLEARRQDAQGLRNWLAAQWPQTNETPTV